MPPEPTTFTAQGAARIIRAVRQFEGLPVDTEGTRSPRQGVSRVRPPAQAKTHWLPFINESSEAIPGYAVINVTGGELAKDLAGDGIENRPFLKATQHDPALPLAMAVNSARTVPPSSASSGAEPPIGWCTFDSPVEVLYNVSGTQPAPEFGQVWGPTDGEWWTVKNSPGFRVLVVTKVHEPGGDKPGRIWCERCPIPQIRFLNKSSETAPAYAVMRITGLETAGIDAAGLDEQPLVVKVDKPNSVANRQLLINGPIAVPAGKYGRGTLDLPAWILYDTASGTPSLGDSWGPKNGAWKLSIHRPGFTVVGGAVAADEVVYCERENTPIYLGKTDAAITQGTSGTVSVWAGTPAGIADTTDNIASCFSRFMDLASGAWVTVQYINGHPYAAGEC
jgi:hypothetical protein